MAASSLVLITLHLMLTLIISMPFIMKYQHLIDQKNVFQQKAVILSGMTVTRSALLKSQTNKFVVFVMVVCLSLLTICCLRVVEAATTTATVDANIISTLTLVAQTGIVNDIIL